MTIAGYTTNSHKTLPESKYNIGKRRINLPPCNIKTLFARAIVAATSSYNKIGRIGRLKNVVNKGKGKIVHEDALAWRNDDHLGKYTVSSLFGPAHTVNSEGEEAESNLLV